jgi:hypothetical protein
VFEIPTGKPDSDQPMVLNWSHRQVARQAFRIAAPGRRRPFCWIDDKNMGQHPARRKRADNPWMCRAWWLIPGAATFARLIDPALIDKMPPSAV